MKTGLSRFANLEPRMFWQLSLAFAAIIFFVGGGMFLVWRFAWEQFGPAFEDGSMVMHACLEELSAYYGRYENWAGVEDILDARPCRRGWTTSERGFHSQDVLLLADESGVIIAASGADRQGQTLSESEQTQALPLVYDNRLVGQLYASVAVEFGSNFFSGLLWVGGALIGVSLLMGLLLSRCISNPISNLTRASHALAAGNLEVRVPLKGRGEVHNLATAFNQMADQVEKTIVTLRLFISDAAHEINTPLMALRTNLELAPQNDAVRQALVQAQRLEELAAGLLDLSRIEGGTTQEAHADLSLTALIGELSELYASRAEQAGLDFDLALFETPLTVQGDENQLRCAIGNLLDNAIKFTSEGGRVALALRQVENEVVITIEDTGIGILEADRARLFNRFYRGSNAHAYPGNGLGLAIVKAIVEAHGGQIEFESATPGARFLLRFPLAGK